jgi:hypothetical protein
MADRESSAVGYRLRGFAPPALSTYPDSVKLMFWQWVVDIGLEIKDKELAKGWDKNGQVHPLRPKTIKYRKSEVGPVTKTAPRLTPALDLSRTRSLLTGRAHATSAEFWWKFDSLTGDSWAVILHYAARQGHDVFGLSDAGTAQVTRQALAKWKAWEAKQGRVRPVAAVPGAKPIGMAEFLRPIRKIEIKGHLDITEFDLGGDQVRIERSIKAGQFSGFRRLNARGEQWVPGEDTGLEPQMPPASPRPPVIPRPQTLKGEDLIKAAHQILQGMGVPAISATLEEIKTAMPNRYLSNAMPAVFDERSGRVFLNMTSDYWSNPSKVLKASRQQGWFAVHEPEHVAIHEAVHALHLQSLARQLGDVAQAREAMKAMVRETFKGDQLRAIQKAVGRYGAIAPAELVAEIGAAIRQGRTFPDWIMALYRKYGGPDIPHVYR